MIRNIEPCPKQTDWFPAHVKPVTRGVYKIRVTSRAFVQLRYWTGCTWLLGRPLDYFPGALTAEHMHKLKSSPVAGVQNVEWCGLVEPHENY
jgi:hypothetical protein